MKFPDGFVECGKPHGPRSPLLSGGEHTSAFVVVVDDDLAARDMVCAYLSENGIVTAAVSGWQDLRGLLDEAAVDLVVLDIRLGREDGLDVLREIRARSDVPVIIASGQCRDEVDRVIGLELGADDYLTKPFGLRELHARIRAILRRRGTEIDETARRKSTGHSCYAFNGWQLDRRSPRLTNPDGAPVPLTKSEYALLIAFLDAPQRPLTREFLLQATRVHEDIFDRSIDVQVLRLRRKLEADPASPKFIQTERGVGYVFSVPVTKGWTTGS